MEGINFFFPIKVTHKYLMLIHILTCLNTDQVLKYYHLLLAGNGKEWDAPDANFLWIEYLFHWLG